MFHGGKKFVPQAPDGFDKAWKGFKRDWERPLVNIYLPIGLSALFPDLANDNDESGGKSTKHDQITYDETEPPDPDFDTEYNPLYHDGGKALEMAFWTTENYASEVGSEFEDTIHNASKIGLDAYDYLKNTIGFDASSVFRRWRQVPVIFMPAHVSDHHGLTEKGALYDLLENAARAYVFGAPAAAIAMCRAVLEMVLRNHYELDHQNKSNEGRKWDKGLGELIILADKRYEFIDGKQLKDLTKKANKVMHKNELSPPDEKTIVEFLKTIKFLIEKAPETYVS